MEALILILIEALGALVAPLAASAAALVGGAFSSLFSLLIHGVPLVQHLLSRTRSPKPAAAEPATPPTPRPPRSPWPRRLLIACSGLTATLLLTLAVVNQWFLGDIARALLERQRERTGIRITAETIDGNLFTGRFHAGGLTIVRSGHPAGDIDLTVRSVAVEVPVWRVFHSVIPIDVVTVAGVHGRYERGIPGGPIGSDQGDEPAPRQRRQFTIAALTITDVDLAFTDHTRKRPLAVAATVEELTVRPLRSRWAIFDLLFRGNATGTIAGRPFRITTTGDDLGRTTEWTADGLPVALLASQIGGPFALLRDGTCAIQVHDHWRMADDARVIAMDWSLELADVTAEVPAEYTTTTALLAKPVVAWINDHHGRLPLSFTMEIDEDRFDGTVSLDAAGLWTVVRDALTATLAKHLGISPDKVKEVGDAALEKAKAVLEKWRKPKEK